MPAWAAPERAIIHRAPRTVDRSARRDSSPTSTAIAVRSGRAIAAYFAFFLLRSGTTVVTAGANGAMGFGGEVSFFGFFTSLVLRC